jgi:ankyrin repeat protein
LHIAARNGNQVAIHILLAQPTIAKDQLTNALETPLHQAVRSGCVQTLALLLNGGCNPFYYNGMGQSALDIARLEFDQPNFRISIEAAI